MTPFAKLISRIKHQPQTTNLGVRSSNLFGRASTQSLGCAEHDWRASNERERLHHRLGHSAESTRGIAPRVPHRTGHDTLAASGSCHSVKAAAFHRNQRAHPVFLLTHRSRRE